MKRSESGSNSNVLAISRRSLLQSAGAVELIKDHVGAVKGVVTEDSGGKRSDIGASNVVIASGGCASNPVMYEQIHGVPVYSRFAYPFSQGDGLSLGLEAGGYLRGAENYISAFGSVKATLFRHSFARLGAEVVCWSGCKQGFADHNCGGEACGKSVRSW